MKITIKMLAKLLNKTTIINLAQTDTTHTWTCDGSLSNNGYIIFYLNNDSNILVKGGGIDKLILHKADTKNKIPHFTIQVESETTEDYKDGKLRYFHFSLTPGKNKELHKFRTSDYGCTQIKDPDYSDLAKLFLDALYNKIK
ncbi:MAG: hypothetical protein HOO91_16830 [Bacteroidales bacterium]|nr:hypothetical protein [Bacteroidales bacterium]